MSTTRSSFFAFALLLLAACQPAGHGGVDTVDQSRIENADSEPGNWLSYGRTYSEQRFSPLTKVDTKSVGKLGLAWAYETREGRGAEATPIVVDGVMYVSSAWSTVYALDAKTGKELWVFDPKVDRSAGGWACCDVVNRGVAVWKGRVYVGTTDGRLIAINAKDGTKVWDVATYDHNTQYTITGAPRVAKGLVFIGNGGAEFGVRGFVTAYDADTGALKWRFYTVPGDPSKGPDHAASDPQMAMAAKTWNGKWWVVGGGGTVWDSIVYDQELDQLYIGVGNGSPWDRKVRSPGGGDNLFLSSIVALKPETGEYLWHFQETPGESWDYTATQPIMLATLKIGGADRKVIMHAPKNGFFYVLDRTNGKFISGKNFVAMAKASDTPKGMPISWAYGLDENGRPLENPQARYVKDLAVVTPSGLGAHNWQPMSYSPQTGLVYFPARHTYSPYVSDKVFVYKKGLQNTGNAAPPKFGNAANDPPALKTFSHGELLAWDPVAQKPAWSVSTPYIKNGGTLATAGGLVFWGDAGGAFGAYDARDGKKLWGADSGTPIITAPITYQVDGDQYVAVMTGTAFGAPYKGGVSGVMPKSRVLVYKIGGAASLPAQAEATPMPAPPVVAASAATIARGEKTFAPLCSQCHGWTANATGVVPDLRRSLVLRDKGAFLSVVHGGRAELGMPDFSKWIKPDEVEAIRAYLAAQAKKAYDADKQKK
jgi:PQQ-dependent dehydrogenase (methanol/ethanol family)